MSNSTEQNTAPKSCFGCLSVLLLFIGFVFGFAAGIYSKDAVMQNYMKLFMQGKSEVEQPLPKDPIKDPKTLDTDKPVVDEQKSDDDEKKEEGNATQPQGDMPTATDATPVE